MRDMHRLMVLASAAAAVIAVPVTLSIAGQPTLAQTHRRATPAAAGQRPAPHRIPGSNAHPRPADAYVYIGWPNDGETIHTTHINVWFGTRNFGVAPAGTNKPNTGHHHLLIDTAAAAAGRADPERQEPPAFRARPDRNDISTCRPERTRCKS